MSQSDTPTPSEDTEIRAVREKDPYRALGLAVNYLMTKPAFARLGFGHWSRILVGQINRGHCLFFVKGGKVVGFFGWALTDREKAEKWVRGQLDLSYKDSLKGDHVLFNAWASDSKEVVDHMKREVRKLVAGKKALYFKRFYNDGRIRPMILSVNKFLDGHS